jgi:hypothetical protein
VDDDLTTVDRFSDGGVIEHVTLGEMQMRMPIEMRKLQRVAMQVVEDDDVIVFNELGDEM